MPEVTFDMDFTDCEKITVQVLEYDYEMLMKRMVHDMETGCLSDPYEVNLAKAMADVLEYYGVPVAESNKTKLKLCQCT